MSDLSTEFLQQLLNNAGPRPWDYVPGDAPDERCIVNLDKSTPCIAIVENDAGSDCTDDDLILAALGPELAQEVLRLRITIQGLANAMDNKAKTESIVKADVIAGYIRDIVLRGYNG